MPIILVTGKNGNGKGQFIIREILRLQKENDKRETKGLARRRIFTNIHGINEYPNKPLPDCEPLPDNPLIFFGKQDDPNNPPPDGYFIPPIGSIFIFDEAQQFDWVKNKSGALSSDIRVTSLETHRHSGLDVYFLTQSPNYIHSHIQGLVGPHYYVERSTGLNTSNVFKYGNYQKSPESPTTKKRADDNSIMKLGKEYGQYYVSGAEHNMKSPVPLKLKLALSVFVACIAFTLYKMQGAGFIGGKDDKVMTDNSSQIEPIKSDTKINDEVKDAKTDELNNRRIYLMSQQLPKDYEVIKSEPALQVRGVVQMGDSCKAYNTFGDLMTLTIDECKYYIEQVGRVHKPLQRQDEIPQSEIQPLPKKEVQENI